MLYLYTVDILSMKLLVKLHLVAHELFKKLNGFSFTFKSSGVLEPYTILNLARLKFILLLYTLFYFIKSHFIPLNYHFTLNYSHTIICL